MQVVDFHDNFGYFRIVFQGNGPAFNPAVPPTSKRQETLRIAAGVVYPSRVRVVGVSNRT